jgi:hypothetical protein
MDKNLCTPNDISLLLHTQMKKAFIYLFLVFLLFNFSSVMLALKLCQLQAKYEMAHKMKMQQKTERLTFHKSHFKQRLKRGSEFDWDNKRFDVVNASYEADSVFVEAINDTREKGILHFIGKFMHQHQKGNKDASKISNLCLLIFQAPLPEEIMFKLPVKEHSCYYYFEVQRINKVYHQIQAPPPRFV